ncbi:hypothetical protein [Thalassoroseus pseudoceratinae]|uniref:hypothetical protein n=1 Tax=Thalassoroseus pseudoceratinae TaxID=2713176 RepID=UPI00141FF3C2|nr:hypothetical protein [Thalassoroseus pseudoceratinae]
MNVLFTNFHQSLQLFHELNGRQISETTLRAWSKSCPPLGRPLRRVGRRGSWRYSVADINKLAKTIFYLPDDTFRDSAGRVWITTARTNREFGFHDLELRGWRNGDPSPPALSRPIKFQYSWVFRQTSLLIKTYLYLQSDLLAIFSERGTATLEDASKDELDHEQVRAQYGFSKTFLYWCRKKGHPALDGRQIRAMKKRKWNGHHSGMQWFYSREDLERINSARLRKEESPDWLPLWKAAEATGFSMYSLQRWHQNNHCPPLGRPLLIGRRLGVTREGKYPPEIASSAHK